MDDQGSGTPDGPVGDWLRRRLLLLFLALLMLGLAWLMVVARGALLLLFAAVLLAIFLHDLATRLRRWLPVPHKFAVAIVVLAALCLFGAVAYIGSARIADQASQLWESLPTSLELVYDRIGRTSWGHAILANLPEPSRLFGSLSQWLPRAGPFFGGLLGVLANLVVIFFVSTYLAAQPSVYRYGLMLLLPPRSRHRAGEVLETIRRMLAQWLLGKALSMLVVGLLTGLGLALLGMPLALVLGVIAGLLDFIPYLGPVLSGVPAVMLALMESPSMALWVALLFFAIQMAEGYLLIPLIERRTVSLPPAATIFMQLVMGTLFGLGGVALATPLVAVLAVLITMLYVQDLLKVPADPPGTQ